MWTKRNLRSKRFRLNLLQKFALIRSHVRKELTIRKCKTTAWAIIIFIVKYNFYSSFLLHYLALNAPLKSTTNLLL